MRALVVDGQRVVHVEADQLHAGQPQVAVDEDAPGPVRLPALAGSGQQPGQLGVVQKPECILLGGPGLGRLGPLRGAPVDNGEGESGRRRTGVG